MFLDTDTSVTREAQLLINIGRAKEAIPLLTRAISADPQSVDSRCLLSMALFKLDRFEESLAAAGDAVAVAPQSEWAHRLRAMNLIRLKRNSEALSEASLAASISPNVPATLHTLAVCQADNGKLSEARVTSDALILRAPDGYLTYHTAGLVALRDCRWADAETHCRKALSIEPLHWESMHNLGVALKRQGKKREAIERFHDAVRLNPKAESSRTKLREAVGAHISVSFTGIFVVFLVIKSLVTATSIEDRPMAAWMGVFAFLTIVAGYALWQRRRLGELNQNVKHFYQTEKLRIRRQNVLDNIVRKIATLAGVGLITVFFVRSVNANIDAGPGIPIFAFCALLAFVLVVELITLMRRK